jgi:hypothetical protein
MGKAKKAEEEGKSKKVEEPKKSKGPGKVNQRTHGKYSGTKSGSKSVSKRTSGYKGKQARAKKGARSGTGRGGK